MLLIALTLVTMAGTIAYAGDYVGRYVGRRRLTIFNLRPKYTAILILVLTGMAIALSTVGTLALLFPQSARVILQANEVRVELAQLQAEVEELRQLQQQLEADNAQRYNEVRQLTAAIENLQLTKDELQRNYDELQAGYETALQEVANAVSQLEQVKAQLEQSELTRQALQQAIDAQVLQVQDTEAERLRIEERLRVLNAAYSNLQRENLRLRRNERITAQVVDSNDPVVVRSRLAAILDSARQAVGEGTLGGVILAFQSELACPATEGDGTALLLCLTDAVAASLDQDLVTITSRWNAVAGDTVPALISLVPNEVLIPANEVLAQSTIPPGQLDRLAELVAAARSAAQSRGVLVLDGEPDPSVVRSLLAQRGATVAVVAARDIRRSGPLNLEFRLQRR
ncbi:MAG: DUF3084 domain-containing protein [Deinococcus sp.]|nr:DUF3084 domain-containing protein [Deinococcus sp.]